MVPRSFPTNKEIYNTVRNQDDIVVPPVRNMRHVNPVRQSGPIPAYSGTYTMEDIKKVYDQTNLGYDYGGVKALRAGREKGKSFLSFNLEQQGDIITDYFRIKNGYQPRWGNGSTIDLSVYAYFVNQVKNQCGSIDCI